MNNQIAVSLGIPGFVAFILVAPANVLLAQGDRLIMQQYVASQAFTELALRTHSQSTRVAPNDIRLERVVGIVDGLEVWRATLPSDHSHPFLVASLNGGLVRLGGFTAPELSTVASYLVRDRLDVRKVRALAEQLALLGDRNGAVQSIFAAKADQPSYVSLVALAWKKQTPSDWPPDTVVATKDGWVAQLTLLSRNTRSYALDWEPLVFSFEFDQRGRVLGWAERTGQSFGVPGVPLRTH